MTTAFRWAEPVAAGLNCAYTIGYLLEAPWAYPAALLGSLLFIGVCLRARLLAEAALWAVYAAFAVWGLVRTADAWEPAISDPTAHAIGLGLGFVVWPVATVALRKWSAAERPGLDVFTTVGSLLATYWMVTNDPWNWWYWVVVNAVAIVLYARSGLVWGTALQGIYLVLALEGLFDFLPWP